MIIQEAKLRKKESKVQKLYKIKQKSLRAKLL